MNKFFRFEIMPDDKIRFQITEVGGDPTSKTFDAEASVSVHFLTIPEIERLTRSALETLGRIPPDKHPIPKNL